MPRRQRMMKTLRAAFVGSAFFAFDIDTVLRAQEPTKGPTPAVVRPALPETQVEAQPNPNALALPDTQVQAQQQGNNTPFDQDPIQSFVNGNTFLAAPVQGYLAPSSTAGTLTNTPNLLFPGSIATVTQDLIKDQQILSLAEATRNLSGVTIGAGDGIVGDKIFVRGQELTTYSMRKDGFFDPSYIPRDFANIERIDVLKGPASILYGGGDPAGMLNVVTKRALAGQSFQNFYYTFGSFQQERYGVDMNGNVNQSGTLIYRINAVHEETNSFRDFNYINRTMIAPSFTWIVDEDTTVSWNSEYHTDNRRGDTGIPAIGGNVFAVPYRNYMGQPAVDNIHYTDYRTNLMFNKRFSDQWSGYAGIQGQWYGFPGTQTSAGQPDVGTEFFQSQQVFSDRESSTSFIANMAGNVDTGNVNHKMLFGFEQVYYESKSVFSGTSLTSPFDAANPVYSNPPYASFPTFNASFPAFNFVRTGVYANDLMKFSDNWYGMIGCRADRLNVLYNRDFGFGLESTDQDFYHLSPRAGLIYQPIPDVMSLYYTYSRSFAPPNPAGAFPTNPAAPLTPVLGEMHEIGVKTQLNDSLQLTVAGFHSVQSNQNFTDPFTFTFTTYNNRSQGADVNLIGKVTDYFSLTANYVYADTHLTGADPVAFFGQRALNTPLNTANFWARYNFVQTDERTIGAALGWTHLGKRSADIGDDLTLPAYSLWTLGAFYKQGKFYANFDLINIFSQKYIQSSIDSLHLIPGAPITARATMGYIF